jgi:multiple antibiotic resistance protein
MPVGQSFVSQFVLTFVPLFIAIDAIGNVPFVITLTEGMDRGERLRVINIATMTALIVGLIFLFFGQLVLKLLGISVGSFAISGGIVLLILSIRYITTGHIVDVVKEEMVAVVPIGTPLTVGPATITTLIILANQYSIYVVLLSFLLNILINWIVFLAGGWITGFLGQGGVKAISKVFSLLLAAIAVNMMLHGLELLGILTLPK